MTRSILMSVLTLTLLFAFTGCKSSDPVDKVLDAQEKVINEIEKIDIAKFSDAMQKNDKEACEAIAKEAIDANKACEAASKDSAFLSINKENYTEAQKQRKQEQEERMNNWDNDRTGLAMLIFLSSSSFFGNNSDD